MRTGERCKAVYIVKSNSPFLETTFPVFGRTIVYRLAVLLTGNPVNALGKSIQGGKGVSMVINSKFIACVPPFSLLVCAASIETELKEHRQPVLFDGGNRDGKERLFCDFRIPDNKLNTYAMYRESYFAGFLILHKLYEFSAELLALLTSKCYSAKVLREGLL